MAFVTEALHTFFHDVTEVGLSKDLGHPVDHEGIVWNTQVLMEDTRQQLLEEYGVER